MPSRLQRKRQKGYRLPASARCVTRPSPFSNPFKIVKPMPGGTRSWRVVWHGRGPSFADVRPDWFEPSEHATQEDAHLLAVDHFRRWLDEPGQAALRERVRRELAGRDLACYCRPGLTCHADVLLRIANEPG